MKKHDLFLVIYFLCLLFISPSVYASKTADSKFPSSHYTILTDTVNKSERDDRQYQVIKLANAMKVLLISDTKAVKSLASLALPVGSLYDPKSQQGLAHYTEHMVLMGSQKYPQPADFSEYLSQHAGSYNASTALYRTAFYFEVEHSAFAQALDRLADAIAAPLLDAKYANKERNAVDAELTMARTNDGFRMRQVDAETINQAHAAAMFSGGNLQTLSDKEDSHLQTELEAFHRRYYSANIMVGVVYSHQSLAELTDLAVDTFGRIDNKNTVISPVSQVPLTPDTLGKWIYMEPAQSKKVLYLQFPLDNNLVAFADKSEEYIGYMISNRSQNTLFDHLQKQGLIESINASSDPLRYGNSGVFGIYVNLTDQGLAEKERVVATIFSYLRLLQHKGINATYYEELKKVLALEFKYPDINRDMSYAQWLAEQLLLYPTTHILDADYVADNFNEQAIMRRLASLTPDNARIWVIAPNQKTDKKAYFVNAPYRIEAISSEQLLDLMEQTKHSLFERFVELPRLNSYIPDRFDMLDVPDAMTTNTVLANSSIFNPQGNHFHFASKYFTDEPKATIALSLRNNFAQSSDKNQVMFHLLDYLAHRELATLRFQASVAGMTISTQADNGLMITVSGFNQHLIDMVTEVLTTYWLFTITDDSLLLAKSWYQERLDAASHVNPYSLAMQPIHAVSSVPYFEREIRREVVSSITTQELEQYRRQLLTDSVPYMLSLGNLSYRQSYDLYSKIKNTLNKTASYQPIEIIKVNQKMDVIISQHTVNTDNVSTDNALFMGFVPKSYDKTTSRATSYLLYKMISPWFYDQLRSEEQLGYAVFTLPINIGDSSGIGFLIQSNQYDPAYLNDRYQAFYPVALDKLTALSDSEFAQYKQSALDELGESPQTLDDEFDDYLADFSQSLFDFDSKHKAIERLKSMTKDDVIAIYKQAVIEHNGLVFASEVIGNQPDKVLQQVENLTQYLSASDLQKALLIH